MKELSGSGKGSRRNRFIHRALLGYAAFALGWIFLSDRLLSLLADVRTVAWISTVKGAIFVAMSSVLLYFLLLMVPDREDRLTAPSLLETIAAPPSASRWHPAALYLFALALAGATLLLRLQLDEQAGDRPLLVMFMIPIVLSALLGGLAPGLAATAVAALGSRYFLLPPEGSFRVANDYDVLAWSLLVAAGLAVSVLSEGLHQARRRAEAQHRLLDAVVSGSQDAIFVKDLQGRYILCNAGTARIIGRQIDDILGQDDRALFPPEAAAAFHDEDQAVMESGRSTVVEERLASANGPSYVFLSHKGPVHDQNGRVVGLFGISRDITERKRAEEEIRRLNADLESQVRKRTEELEHSNEALQRSNLELQHFAHAAAHDLQAPLRSIAGFAQLLQAENRERLDGQSRQWLGFVIDNSRRLQDLIRELLAYSRLDAEPRPFKPADLGQVFREVAAALAVPIRETGAEVDCGELPTVACDRTQIAQLLQNLIENGMKYNAAKPPRVEVSCERSEGEWVFSVADNGIGIDPRHYERVFEIFRRLHSYDQIPGSGIGLALCRRIVERHGGRIWVESRPGGGSTFRFTLPATLPAS